MVTSSISPLLSASAVECVTGLSRRTIARAVERGTFPPPVVLPGTGQGGRSASRRLAWRSADIQAWINSLAPACEALDGGTQHV